MTRRAYWGIATLIILLIGASVFILMHKTNTDPEVVNINVDSSKETIEKAKVPPVGPGQILVKHGDHSHSNEVLGAGSELAIPVAPEPSIPGLTYHAELLKTNPVKALRFMAEELGHWSKDHIPPFPPDDLEAQEFARNKYLCEYLKATHPEYKKAERAYLEQLDAINAKYPYGARRSDLKRLMWVGASGSEPKVLPYHSDYFKYENPFIKKALELNEKTKIK